MTDKDITKIRIFGSDEDSLKTLGQLLSNETSRKIILCLNGNEMYINQISKACGIQMNLTIHHVKKLEEVGLVSVVEKPIVRKGVNHKFYKMIPNVFVNTTQTKQEIHRTGLFKRIFKNGVKFAVVTFVGFASWATNTFNNFQGFSKPAKDSPVESITVVNKTTDIIRPETNEPGNFFLVPIIVIGASLFLIWFSNKYK